MGKFLIFCRIQLKFNSWLHKKRWNTSWKFQLEISSNKKLSPKSLWQTYMKWTVTYCSLLNLSWATPSLQLTLDVSQRVSLKRGNLLPSCVVFNPFPYRNTFNYLCKQRRPRSGSSCRSCLIKVYSVCL